jgi:hypothetical protein
LPDIERENEVAFKRNARFFKGGFFLTLVKLRRKK